jgi:hypothetical protein
MELNLSFPHSYDIEEFQELPGTGTTREQLYYFPRPSTRPEHDGTWLKVHNREPWIGVFAFGYTEPPAISCISTTPNPDRVCIVSSGAAYIVNAQIPDSWEQIPTMPVLDVRSVPQHQLLIFADFTRLTAYGADGIVWQSSRICWDELKIIRVGSESIQGVGYDPIKLRESQFAVDIKTGRSLLPPPKSVDGQAVW